MGNNSNKVEEREILISGLYNAGKNTILQKVNKGEVAIKLPTTGSRGISVSIKNNDMDAFEFGGRFGVRPVIQYYYKDTSALIFVVDSAGRDRMQDVKYELHSVLKEESLQDAVIMVLANKQDLPEAVSIQEAIQMLDLNDIKQRHCNIFGTCATTGEGLHEAFAWLSTALANKDQHTSSFVDQIESSGKPIVSTKGPKGYLKKLRASVKNAFLS